MRAGSSWAKAPADATRSGVMPCTATASDRDFGLYIFEYTGH